MYCCRSKSPRKPFSTSLDCFFVVLSEGILRFKSNQSVDLAINRFRTGEIVVQDVAVQVKILRPGGNNSSSDDDEALSAGVPTGLLS
jgi:hypothetical protein